jgi:hypothetical protein
MQLIARHADGTLDVLRAQQSDTESGAGMANTSSQMMSKLNWIEALRRLEVRLALTAVQRPKVKARQLWASSTHTAHSVAHSIASSACSLLPIDSTVVECSCVGPHLPCCRYRSPPAPPGPMLCPPAGFPSARLLRLMACAWTELQARFEPGRSEHVSMQDGSKSRAVSELDTLIANLGL